MIGYGGSVCDEEEGRREGGRGGRRIRKVACE